MSPKCNAAAAGATKGVARTAPTIEKRAPAEKLTVDAARAAADLNLAPAQKMPLAKAAPSVVVPPALVRAGTVTPPETRSPTGRGRADAAAVPSWPPGVLVAVNATVPKVSSSA